MKRNVIGLILGSLLSVVMVMPCMAEDLESIPSETISEEEIIQEDFTYSFDDMNAEEDLDDSVIESEVITEDIIETDDFSDNIDSSDNLIDYSIDEELCDLDNKDIESIEIVEEIDKEDYEVIVEVEDGNVEREEVDELEYEDGSISGNVGPNATYNLNGTVLTISGYGPLTGFDNKLSSTDKNNVTELRFASGSEITSISNMLFENWSGLETVKIPASVDRIGTWAFNGCVSLTNLNFSSTAITFGGSAFSNCESLVNVVLPSKSVLGAGMFGGCSHLLTVEMSNVSTIPSNMFSGCTSLNNVKMGDKVVWISDYAFVNCISLESITLSNSLKEIGMYAFDNCISLKEVKGGKVLEKIGLYAFNGCSSLKTIVLSPTVSYISSSFPNNTSVVFYVSDPSYALDYARKNGISYKIIAGWTKKSGRWLYKHIDGIYVKNAWENVNGKWYHFDGNGYMQTGWIKVNNKWYYLNSNGVMQTGWIKVSDKWYYLNSNGVMQTGWQKIGYKWYYMNANGVMQRGWIKLNGKDYYLYYDGHMAANEWIGRYHVNSNGVWDRTR